MSYDVYIKDGEKAVIVLEITDEWRAYVASQFYSSVSAKSEWRFNEQDELVRNWFWIYRADADKFESDYDYRTEFDSLKKAIRFCKDYNNEAVEERAEQPAKCQRRPTINMSVNILNSNKENMSQNVNVLEKYEQDAYFTKENLAKASQVNSNVKSAVEGLRRVVELLANTADKVEYIGAQINSSANSYSVDGTKKALERAEKVLLALTSNEVFKFALDTGKTKLEKDLEAFDVEEFLAE